MVKISMILLTLTFFLDASGQRVCNSCGSECAPACGTRYFRSCCFNYLRKKRGPDNVKLLKQNHEWKGDNQWTMPIIAPVDTQWKDMPSDLKLDQQEDIPENVLQALYVN